jgi:hypothetical protein
VNVAMAHRIIEAARREDEAWRALVSRSLYNEENEVAIATEYVEASVALAVEIDNYRTGEGMRKAGNK